MDSKKILAIIVVAMLLCVGVITAVVLSNNNNNNSSGTKDIEITTEGPFGEYTCTYNDGYFKSPASEYNKKLATASYCLVMASCAKMSDMYQYEKYDQNIREFAEKAGFTNPASNDEFNKKPTVDSMGTFAASKEIGDYTLIMVGLRLGDYEMEWVSDFKVGKSDYDSYGHHQGFKESADKVLTFIDKYIKDNEITGKIKIWTSGFSRTGATSNIVGGMLDNYLVENKTMFEDVTYTKNDVYVYTFEAPGAIEPKNGLNVHGEDYNNIWNTWMEYDLVPKVPCWNFTVYGNVENMRLPSLPNLGVKEFSSEWDTMLTIFEERGGSRESLYSNAYCLGEDLMPVIDDTPLYDNYAGYLSKFVSLIESEIGNRDNFAKPGGGQESMITISEIMMGSDYGAVGFAALVANIVSEVGEQGEEFILELGTYIFLGDKESFVEAFKPCVENALKGCSMMGFDVNDAVKLSNAMANVVFFLTPVFMASGENICVGITIAMNYNILLTAHVNFNTEYCWLLAAEKK